MTDHLIRLTNQKGTIRAFFAYTKDTVNEASQIHQCSPVVAAAQGRLLTAAAMMGTMLKNEEDLITLSVRGEGPVGSILVTADTKGHVKGYSANPSVDLPVKSNGKLDVAGIVGPGRLTVTKSMGDFEPYSSTVALQTGEIAEDITYYFAQSEQTPSVVGLGVLVDVDHSIRQAGGFFLQLMPGAGEEDIVYLETKLQGLDSVTELFEQGHTTESLADYFFGEVGYQILDHQGISFSCDCSRERTEAALISLGREALEDMIAEDGGGEVVCHFCGKRYYFDEKDIRDFMESSQT